MKKIAWQWQIPLTIILLLSGFLLFANMNRNDAAQGELSRQSFRDLSIFMVSLSAKRDSLSEQYMALYDDYLSMKEAQESGKSTLSALMRRRNNLQIITADTDLEGEGIIITIPQNSKMMRLDLIDLINELYLSGAKVISVNDRYIGLKSVFEEKYDRKANNMLLLDGKVLEYPLTIKALGEPATLEKGITYTGGIIDNLNLLYKLYPQTKQIREIIIKANGELK